MKIISNGGTPILVGGTMMYLNRLIQGISNVPNIPLEVRQSIFNEGRDNGWDKLHKKLFSVDPQFADGISINDSQRITRGLEVWYHTGKGLTEWKNEYSKLSPQNNLSFKLRILALVPKNKEDLHRKIKNRFNNMVERGLLSEVARLRKRNLSRDNSCARLVGVRQAWEFLEGTVSMHQFLQLGEIATRRLAKHQLTWLRKFNNMKVIDPFDNSKTQKISICESLL